MFKAEILTLPPKSPIENVGLGPATQDSRTQKNGCFVCCWFLRKGLAMPIYHTKKTATIPCSGLLVRAPPLSCPPNSSELFARLFFAECTFAQTFGKDRTKNLKLKAKTKFFLSRSENRIKRITPDTVIRFASIQ